MKIFIIFNIFSSSLTLDFKNISQEQYDMKYGHAVELGYPILVDSSFDLFPYFKILSLSEVGNFFKEFFEKNLTLGDFLSSKNKPNSGFANYDLKTFKEFFINYLLFFQERGSDEFKRYDFLKDEKLLFDDSFFPSIIEMISKMSDAEFCIKINSIMSKFKKFFFEHNIEFEHILITLSR